MEPGFQIPVPQGCDATQFEKSLSANTQRRPAKTVFACNCSETEAPVFTDPSATHISTMDKRRHGRKFEQIAGSTCVCLHIPFHLYSFDSIEAGSVFRVCVAGANSPAELYGGCE